MVFFLKNYAALWPGWISDFLLLSFWTGVHLWEGKHSRVYQNYLSPACGSPPLLFLSHQCFFASFSGLGFLTTPPEDRTVQTSQLPVLECALQAGKEGKVVLPGRKAGANEGHFNDFMQWKTKLHTFKDSKMLKIISCFQERAPTGVGHRRPILLLVCHPSALLL